GRPADGRIGGGDPPFAAPGEAGAHVRPVLRLSPGIETLSARQRLAPRSLLAPPNAERERRNRRAAEATRRAAGPYGARRRAGAPNRDRGRRSRGAAGAPGGAAGSYGARRLSERPARLEEVWDELRIQNLGVIADATLPLAPGLTCITGETGAGKTMVVAGLGLLFGGRASRAPIGAEKAVVEGRLLIGEDTLELQIGRAAGRGSVAR